MVPYEIQFKSSAARELRKLTPEIKLRIRTTLNALKKDPRPAGVKKIIGEENLYRIRVSDYRIIYTIDDNDRIIQVTRIRHRRDVYQ